MNTCCPMGSYEHQVPMPIGGRVRGIDYCIADLVAALNAANIKTEASCCGHEKQSGMIMLEDGRELVIKNVKNHDMEQWRCPQCFTQVDAPPHAAG